MWKCSQVFSLQNTYLRNCVSVRHWPPEALLFQFFWFLRQKKTTGMCQKLNLAGGVGKFAIHMKSLCSDGYDQQKIPSTNASMTPKNGLESRSPSSKIQIFYFFAYCDHVIYIFWNFWLDNRNHRPKLPLGTRFEHIVLSF